MKTKKCYITVRLTEPEKNYIVKKAERDDRTVSQTARLMIQAAMGDPAAKRILSWGPLRDRAL